MYDSGHHINIPCVANGQLSQYCEQSESNMHESFTLFANTLGTCNLNKYWLENSIYLILNNVTYSVNSTKNHTGEVIIKVSSDQKILKFINMSLYGTCLLPALTVGNHMGASGRLGVEVSSCCAYAYCASLCLVTNNNRKNLLYVETLKESKD